MHDYILNCNLGLPTKTNSSICFFWCRPANIYNKHHPWITTRLCALVEITQINISFLYFPPIVIKDWSVSAPYSHLAGGMKYHDGKLTVPTSGRYYVYLQVFYQNNGKVYIRVNGKHVTMAQSPWPGKGDHSTAYTAGVFNLKSGDVITIASAYANCKIYMYTYHTYFGAYLI